MKISTRMRYGTRAITELALFYNKGALSLKEIAVKQKIPARYLAQIMFSLKAARLVKTVRGKDGGFILARAPEEISVGDIFEKLEMPIAPKECRLEKGALRMCKKYETCPTAAVWTGLEDAVRLYLGKIKIAELAKNKTEIKKSAWL
jgi:Rrf2 family protein